MILLIKKTCVILAVWIMKRNFLLTSGIWIKSKGKKINGDVVTRIG